MKKVIKPHFTVEFKRDAAQLVIAKGYSIKAAAESLGVSESALRKWVSKEQNGSIVESNNFSKAKLNLTEHEELIKLRKEVTRLKMEREILKKASSFFAQEIL